MKKKLLIMVLLMAGLCVAGFSQEQNATLHSRGKFLYEEYAGCASCHGFDGRGKVEGVTLNPPPPDLSNCGFNTREPRRDWFAVIARGGSARGLSMSMPAYGDVLTSAEIDTIISYLKTFCREDDWPPGELNFRRPHVTSKAFPENEAVLVPTYTAATTKAATTKMVYEKRWRSRGQWEIAVPFVHETGSSAATGLGDIELSAKYVLAYHAPSLFILSGGLETALPTADLQSIGLGNGVWKLSPYLAAARGFSNFYLQSSVKFEKPVHANEGESELRYNLALTVPLTREKKGFFPMLELNGITITDNGKTEWFVTPQLYIGLVRRGHIAFSLGSQIPVGRERPFDYRLMSFLLWEYADGGLWW
ncbi:MAG: cytochrome c [candidate division KSB1 bacterium]|nr:cytochrome c [candidate division KSB1 bacterium]MDZ7275757.1 cytochrome c [candidate division KSB1 bacterium]MDZ7284552.1 cytochrome c [candidate division KSB1 bacterium]MDZ7298029.1 cytochrome c [candidate division KSB1 bacterium]MDZ7307744.1 cytochrome c [candidate division KSB1 bacterium]